VSVKISNRFVALENLDDDVDISRAWEVLEYESHRESRLL
jgi:hypothetical protein